MIGWLDCEFNGFGGELISMAIVCADGAQWYEVRHISEPVKPWVAEHVMPVLKKRPVNDVEFRGSLGRFLGRFDELHLIVDWPDDVAYFCKALMVVPGVAMATPKKMTFEIDRTITAKGTTPHNALSDARAMAR